MSIVRSVDSGRDLGEPILPFSTTPPYGEAHEEHMHGGGEDDNFQWHESTGTQYADTDSDGAIPIIPLQVAIQQQNERALAMGGWVVGSMDEMTRLGLSHLFSAAEQANAYIARELIMNRNPVVPAVEPPQLVDWDLATSMRVLKMKGRQVDRRIDLSDLVSEVNEITFDYHERRIVRNNWDICAELVWYNSKRTVIDTLKTTVHAYLHIPDAMPIDPNTINIDMPIDPIREAKWEKHKRDAAQSNIQYKWERSRTA
jgi:hypothetical protein